MFKYILYIILLALSSYTSVKSDSCDKLTESKSVTEEININSVILANIFEQFADETDDDSNKHLVFQYTFIKKTYLLENYGFGLSSPFSKQKPLLLNSYLDLPPPANL